MSALTDDQAMFVVVETRPECLCGCGGTPKGKNARYLPGHDARHLSVMKKAAAEAASEPKIAPDRPRRARRPAAVKESATKALPKGTEA